MTATLVTIALQLCLTAPVPMPELVGEMVRDGFGYSDGLQVGDGAVVSVRDAAGRERLMLTLSEEMACEVRE